MRTRVLFTLLGLRYRLLWAQARTRNGKVLLFGIAYLLLSAIAALALFGGIGGAMAAIGLGKAVTVARLACTVPFLFAILAGALYGAGMRQVYADSFLRRYALLPVERLIARHLIAILEPLWILMAAWYLGLAAGFTLLGGTGWWKSIPAAILLLAVNYLCARTLLSVIEHLMATRTGPFVLLAVVAVLFPAPAVLGPLLARHGALLSAAFQWLEYTPPFAAAAILRGVGAWAGRLLLLLAEGGILMAAIAKLDRLSPASRTVAAAKATWDDPWDRIAAIFGPQLAPLIGKILRYYVRSPQLRFNYPFGALGVTILAMQFGRGHPMHGFTAALGAVAGTGSMSMGAMTMNVFGFDGSGFRRYFLLPVAPATVLRAAAIVPLILGSAIVPVSLGLWLAISRIPVDARMSVMLLGSGFAGLFVFQALGIWVSLLAPRAIGFQEVWGNKLSLPANTLMMANLFCTLGLIPLFEYVGADALLSRWWLFPLATAGGAAFYLAALRAAGSTFVTRRERMLSMIERGYCI